MGRNPESRKYPYRVCLLTGALYCIMQELNFDSDDRGNRRANKHYLRGGEVWEGFFEDQGMGDDPADLAGAIRQAERLARFEGGGYRLLEE